MIDKIKIPNNPHRHLLQAQLALALLLPKLVRRPGTGSLPSTIAPPNHPLTILYTVHNKLIEHDVEKHFFMTVTLPILFGTCSSHLEYSTMITH